MNSEREKPRHRGFISRDIDRRMKEEGYHDRKGLKKGIKLHVVGSAAALVGGMNTPLALFLPTAKPVSLILTLGQIAVGYVSERQSRKVLAEAKQTPSLNEPQG